MKLLRDAGVTVIGEFHSPMEKECLNILLRGSQPIIVCPARSLENMRIKPAKTLNSKAVVRRIHSLCFYTMI